MVPYWAGVFRKFGITLDFFKRGRFKSMGSTFLNSRPTIDDVRGYAYWMEDLAAINMEAIIANIPTVQADDDGNQVEVNTSQVLSALSALDFKNDAYKASSLKTIGLIDGCTDRSKLDEEIATLYPDSKDVPRVPIQKYVQLVEKLDEKEALKSQLKAIQSRNMGDIGQSAVDETQSTPDGAPDLEKLKDKVAATPQIAVVRVSGGIMRGRKANSSSTLQSSDIIDFLAKAEKDNMVKGVVLRVDSPGGDAIASDSIRAAIKSFKKPIAASMAGVAASGGYYISSPCDRIFANPATITGR